MRSVAAFLGFAIAAIALPQDASSAASVTTTTTTTTTTSATPSCTSFAYLATVSNVIQKNITGPVPAGYDGTYTSLNNESVSGNYQISAVLCAPTTQVASRNSTLQLLVHGLTYTKTYWSGLEVPPNSFNGSTYSWVDYAASQGYWTLAIDRLCNGNSSHPDPSDVCQLPANAATLHSLVQAARAGSLNSGGKKFSKVIYVGHSLGSELGNFYANTYASDVDALVLTGYSASTINSAAAESFSTFGPATYAIAADSSLPAPYVTIYDLDVFRGQFFYGAFNEAVVDMNFDNRGTGTFGEILSIVLGALPAPNVKIPVYVISGQEDEIVCAVSLVDAVYGGRGQCGTGASSLVARTSVLFPNATNFGYGVIPNTGHCWNLHYTAQQGFQMTHQYLASQGF